MERAPSVFLHPDINQPRTNRLISWLENPAVTRYLNEDRGITSRLRETTDPVFLTCQLNRQGRFFFVCREEDPEPIGFVRLAELKKNDAYELVVAIGREALWGNGYGTQAIIRCLETAFFQRRANTVAANVHADNLRSLRVFEKVGMRRVSQGCGYVHFHLTRDEFLNQRLQSLA
ncbi:GNAT family protein [Oscillibacter sp.]|uniref:GNAT family N-acetyltransferase n=1 Tax=Oscillibacter sp. TaxID=1945593 RepID=UPI0028AD01A5|nr:GNAT family protein [Oscillibacter sp.]